MAVAVFTVIALIAAGALLTVADANRKAQAFKSVINNLNFALESVARTLRTGSGYSTSGYVRGACRSGFTTGITFTSQAGNSTSYFLSGSQIIRQVSGGGNIGVTAPEIQIERFCLQIAGTPVNDDGQPRALLLVGGRVRAGTKLESRFDVQTFITQRLLDS